MSLTREQLLAEHAKAQTRRIELQRKLSGFGGRSRDPYAAKLRGEIADLRAKELEIERQTVALKQRDDRTIGRKYAYLCRAIKHELGEASLAAFIAEADRLSEADFVAAETEGYA